MDTGSSESMSSNLSGSKWAYRNRSKRYGRLSVR
uniref:Uncharacterized protein n=1 Tax=Rhizophora mucronata TaxID=61149 RepID=A0A2P2IN22_RHIMU